MGHHDRNGDGPLRALAAGHTVTSAVGQRARLHGLPPSIPELRASSGATRHAEISGCATLLVRAMRTLSAVGRAARDGATHPHQQRLKKCYHEEGVVALPAALSVRQHGPTASRRPRHDDIRWADASTTAFASTLARPGGQAPSFLQRQCDGLSYERVACQASGRTRRALSLRVRQLPQTQSAPTPRRRAPARTVPRPITRRSVPATQRVHARCQARLPNCA